MFDLLAHAFAQIRTGLEDAVSPPLLYRTLEGDRNDEVTVAFRLADVNEAGDAHGAGRRPVSVYSARVRRTDADEAPQVAAILPPPVRTSPRASAARRSRPDIPAHPPAYADLLPQPQPPRRRQTEQGTTSSDAADHRRRAAGPISYGAARGDLSRSIYEMGVGSDPCMPREWRSCAPDRGRMGPGSGVSRNVADLGHGVW